MGIVLVQPGVGTTPHRHEVFFYDVDRELVAAVVRYVSEGLAQGEPAVVIATAPHLAAIDEDLRAQGTDVASARATGAYLALDAVDTLATFMVDGSPDPDILMSLSGVLLDRPRDAGSDVRAFGEMVALLWDQGNVPGAIALESLWNDLADLHRFSLLCAYPTTGLAAAELRDLNDVCQLHTVVRPPSGYDSPPPPGRTGVSTRSGVFVPAPEAVGAARRFVHEALTSWGENHLVDDGELIVSELATNAVIHGRSPFRTSIERSADAVRIAVEDVGQGLPQSHIAPYDALDGRGVAIVEALSQRWGCDLLDDGKVFWAELGSASARPS